MTMKQWEKKVLERPGASERVAEIEDELRLAAGLASLRQKAGLSQRQLAERSGISQPRIAAIEQSRNVTIHVLDQYVRAVGGTLEVNVVHSGRRVRLISATNKPSRVAKAKRSSTSAPPRGKRAAR